MRNLIAALRLTGLCLLFSLSASASPALLGIKVSVTNPSDQARQREQVVIPIADLRKIAPNLRAGSLIVTATRSADVQHDAATIEATELPSQVDDFDEDGKADELAFQIDLQPRETRTVTITFGPPDQIYQLRGEYAPQTDALFAKKIEGLGWESDKNAWRIYFDPRNAIDLYGKHRSTLLLKRFANPEYDYHAETADGRDIYKVGDALGIGAVGAWDNGKLIKVSDVASRKYRIISSGPVRAIVELVYEGWKVGTRNVTLHSRITQWAGDRGFVHTVTVQNAPDVVLATALPLKKKVPVFHSEKGPSWLATWGEQVVLPGPTATEEQGGTNLGLAIAMISGNATLQDDGANHLLTFPLKDSSASWYTLAAWDQEGINDRFPVGNSQEMQQRDSVVVPHPGIQSEKEFLKSVQETSDRFAHPVLWKIVVSAAAAQSAPFDTLRPVAAKTYTQAISLLQKEIDRTASRFEPIVNAAPPGPMSSNKGSGFFTVGDDQTGEWKLQEGYFWTGSFWVGELWKMYAHTHDEKYRRWAELWNQRLVGAEAQQNHDAGFLYYYSSAFGFEQTRSPELRQSALKGAARVEELFNPKTQLVAAWAVNGDDSIIDTMMNLQLLWWASQQTGNPKWRELGLKHALRTADWFVRPDGSVIQSVHYNPGDNRQRIELRGGTQKNVVVDLQSDIAPPGEMLFSHTHQGLAANTTWSRGAAWALYGFSSAYAATHDPKLLVTAQKVADYVLRELPEDGVPWFDFDDQGVHYRNRDSSAAALISGGLLMLSREVSDPKKAQQYRQESERIAHSIIDRYLTPVAKDDPTPPGVLRHGTGTRPAEGMLIYGQYYLLETLLELEKVSKVDGGIVKGQ
jgi:unsaturated chondroitin disaccharide hydrolase